MKNILRFGEHQVSTAMTAIAMFYTLGSVLGPIATGATVSYVSEHGLMISVGVVGVLFIGFLILRKGSHKSDLGQPLG
ncbi:hypothetical protein [Pseudomonas sp. EA_65y_Pfl1_P113]|uniref:hypothetical protein n=1 Tax=Pseudomonas sp. EA_65y_Pfl1_P113 TaxID=3088692 RepID=UPI0030D93BB4